MGLIVDHTGVRDPVNNVDRRRMTTIDGLDTLRVRCAGPCSVHPERQPRDRRTGIPEHSRGARQMELPTVEDLAAQLQAVSGAAEVDVDAALQQISDIDSLDLMEWLYGFQNKYPHI